jgi:hypothetical protein
MVLQKNNEFSYVLDSQGRVDYVLVEIRSPKNGNQQMPLEIDDIYLLNDGALTLRPSRSSFYVQQMRMGFNSFHRRLFPDIKPEEQVDHINGNTLDNRRRNLRVVSQSENQTNRSSHRSGRLPGAWYDSRNGRWSAYIWIPSKRTSQYISTHDTELEAHQAYKKAFRGE